jgi:hypothetical protein
MALLRMRWFLMWRRDFLILRRALFAPVSKDEEIHRAKCDSPALKGGRARGRALATSLLDQNWL